MTDLIPAPSFDTAALLDAITGGSTVAAAAETVGTYARHVNRHARRDPAGFGSQLSVALVKGRDARKQPLHPHGDRRRYWRGCRCDECTAANTRAQQLYREQLRAAESAQAATA